MFIREYENNIRIVDDGIRQMVATIEEFFQHDKRTSYVFTSDHGMTDWGQLLPLSWTVLFTKKFICIKRFVLADVC